MLYLQKVLLIVVRRMFLYKYRFLYSEMPLMRDEKSGKVVGNFRIFTFEGNKVRLSIREGHFCV